jgi:hypothetical protein
MGASRIQGGHDIRPAADLNNFWLGIVSKLRALEINNAWILIMRINLFLLQFEASDICSGK